MVYIIACVIATLLSGFFTKNYSLVSSELDSRMNGKEYISKLMLFLSFGIYFIVAAFRVNVGTDYQSYATWMIFNVGNGTSGTEFLFRELIRISILAHNAQWVFILSSLITVGLVYLYFINQSLNYPLSTFIFMMGTFYSFSLNGIRQGVATAVFLYATKYIAQKNIWKYYIAIAIAILLHSSAIVYIPLYFINRIEIKKTSTLIGVGVLSGVLFLAKNNLRLLLMKVANNFNNYGRYFNGIYDNNSIPTITSAFVAVNLGILGLTILVFIQKKKDFDKYTNTALVIQIIVTLFGSIASVVPAGFRVFYLFVPVQITLIPNIIRYCERKELRMLITLIVVLMYIILFSLFILSRNYNGTLPYQSVFSQ